MSLEVPAGARSPASYETPLRHHQRKPSTPRQVKETLHAHSEWSNSGDDGAAIHRINQYIISEEIGRGSFGAVHLASDQYGREYAVKEFSKSRLRKRAQSNILRRPGPGRMRPFSPQSTGLFSRSQGSEDSGLNSLSLIKEEVAVMKKLNHPNLVGLLEVLDDPEEDSLYMVLEMCKKGVIMKVGMHEPADPYDSESCRLWFRDLILGIEYLHAQGVAHRDIKPDNLLLNEDDELKIVDFGVSEIFEKSSDLLSAKSAGSPAFLPPELCVTKHGNVSGKAADIWSMGVTLYCLHFGRVPFEKTNILELYASIRDDPILLEGQIEPNFRDLIYKILEKDPEKRIKMKELRNHPWVTRDGTDPLMSEEENVTMLVEPPTEEEVNRAITKNMGNVLAVVKAVKQFKKLLPRHRSSAMEGILGPSSHIVQPPQQIDGTSPIKLSVLTKNPMTSAQRLMNAVHGAKEGISEQLRSQEDSPEVIQSPDAISSSSTPLPMSPLRRQTTDPNNSTAATSRERRPRHHQRTSTDHEGRGQAHDPLKDTIYLGVGTDGSELDKDPLPSISESPSAEDDNIYELAYEAEIERIKKEKGRNATIFLTRRVEQVREHIKESMKDVSAKNPTISGGEDTSTIEGMAKRLRELADAKSPK